MKRKPLLTLVITVSLFTLQAQKVQKITAYAITGFQKGESNWTEVRLVDVVSGEALQTIYQSRKQAGIFNARTGNPIVKESSISGMDNRSIVMVKKTAELHSVEAGSKNDPVLTRVQVKKVLDSRVQSYQPFATNSAACAYDKKHGRLYYTPMGINQLRYIDLKKDAPSIYYFENESFGALKGPGDIPNQITRMVIAADGNGYALSNDGNHLVRFTTGRKMVITDQGALTDDAANGSFSVHSQNGYGGDMVADTKGNLYLITANRSVFRISIDNKTAFYLGTIKGLPKGFTTNGAIVEGGTRIIVSSSSSTQGYYHFDLNDMQAEKISKGNAVFNASDMASATLITEKRKKEKKHHDLPLVYNEAPPADPGLSEEINKKPLPLQALEPNTVSVFPNPVTDGLVKLYFANQAPGRYQVQFIDMSGKIVSTREVTVNNKTQVEEIRLPDMVAKGSYLIKITGQSNKAPIVNKIEVQ